MSTKHKDIIIDFGSITQDNVAQLRMINKSCFPISYNDSFYKDIVQSRNEKLNKFAYHNGFVVGAICSRIEALNQSNNNNNNASDGNNPNGKRLYILTLGVLAAYRNRGIGTKLVKSILDYCEEYQTMLQQQSSSSSSSGDINNHELKDVQEIILHVQISNTDAIHFYMNHFGFEKGELVENYYNRTDPPHCYVMRKKLG